jgi:GT2 family glycosyltransferase
MCTHLKKGGSEGLSCAVVVPVGPGREAALDTLDSVGRYCNEPHEVVIVDDHTVDGTYEALISQRRSNWRILRNPRPMGCTRLVHSLCTAFRLILSEIPCRLVLRLDQDALIVKPGVLSDALDYMRANPRVGIFGVYDRDYNRPRSFESHRRLMRREMSWIRALAGLRPSWAPLFTLAQQRGYRAGVNVFGGAYFITRPCLEAMDGLKALSVPHRWHSKLMEDVYFSMAAVAAGFRLGHFAAPTGPLCLEHRGLPYPARELVESPYKVVHSVDKGKNTDREANMGMTAREYFRAVRRERRDLPPEASPDALASTRAKAQQSGEG